MVGIVSQYEDTTLRKNTSHTLRSFKKGVTDFAMSRYVDVWGSSFEQYFATYEATAAREEHGDMSVFARQGRATEGLYWFIIGSLEAAQKVQCEGLRAYT